MRVIRNGKCVKIVPAKFEPVLNGFEFESESKRLTPNERYGLILRLVRHNFKIREPVLFQDKLAKERVIKCIELKVLRVDKGVSHPDWRVLSDGMEIRVSADDVSDCPEEF